MGSADDVKATLKIFRDFDKDNSGAIDAAELKALCAALDIEASIDTLTKDGILIIGTEASMSEADTLTKDGKIDPKEFFAWYVGCSAEEAAAVFKQHESIFAGLSGKALKEWSADEVKATLKVFQDFDKVAEADTLKKDAKIDPK